MPLALLRAPPSAYNYCLADQNLHAKHFRCMKSDHMPCSATSDGSPYLYHSRLDLDPFSRYRFGILDRYFNQILDAGYGDVYQTRPPSNLSDILQFGVQVAFADRDTLQDQLELVA